MEDRIRKVFLSIFSILFGGIFVLDGITKLFGVTMPYEIIPIRDYPMWLGNVVSIFELFGGLLLLIEDTRFYGSILAVISTIVGIVYGVATPNYLTLVLPVVFFLGSWIIGWIVMPERLLKMTCSVPFLKMTHSCKLVPHH